MLAMGNPVRSYGGKTAEQRAGDRRGRLVAATVELLAERGEAGATMTAICARAGLTERYFYESFAQREDALLAALDHVCEEISTAATRILEQTSGSPEERVHAVMASFVEQVSRRPAVGLVAVVHSSATPSLRARRRDLIHSFADLVAREAASLYGEEAWPAERARVQGLVYVAGFAELVAAWLTGEVDLTPEQLTATARDLFVSLSRRT
jgi:AcrR family transcriptional regulator